MDYSLSEELEMIRSMVRDFATGEVAPTAALRDEEARWDRSLFETMGELGLTSILVPETYGGLGSDVLTNCLVLEELARACASTGYALWLHSALAVATIARFGSEEQKLKFLGPMGSGSMIGTYVSSAPETRAIRDGDAYVLQGTERFVVNADEADVCIVFAMTGTGTGDESTGRACSVFIIEKGTPGFMVGKKENMIGTRGAPCMSIEFVDCRIPAANRLGEEGDGYRIALRTIESARSGIAALSVGLAQAAMDVAIAYAKTRKQFGKPIAQQQAIAFKLANMATQIEAARLLTYQAAWRVSQGDGAGTFTNLLAGETVIAVALEAVQIHGGYGYTKAFPVERYLRDAKMLQMVEAEMDERRRAIVRLLG